MHGPRAERPHKRRLKWASKLELNFIFVELRIQLKIIDEVYRKLRLNPRWPALSHLTSEEDEAVGGGLGLLDMLLHVEVEEVNGGCGQGWPSKN